MIDLILACCASALVSLLMRASEAKVKQPMGMLSVNYIACTLLAAWQAQFSLLPHVPGLGATLGMGAINGFLYLAGFVMLKYNVSRSGVVLSSTFMKLGLLVTMVISIVFFGEKPEPVHLLGFVLAVSAIVLMNTNPSAGGKFHPALLVLLLTGGVCDGMSKVYEELGTPALSNQFLFYTFFVALVLCFALAASKKQLPGRWEWAFGLCIGIPNFFSSFFLLRSLSAVPGVIAYPVFSVATILLITLAGMTLFRERLTRRQGTALGMILLALILLNL